jgi:RNA recognition motif-containing protein
VRFLAIGRIEVGESTGRGVPVPNKKYIPQSSRPSPTTIDSTKIMPTLNTPSSSTSNDKGSSSSNNFRDDFIGTRAFIKNIPLGIDWKDLKDFFKSMNLKVIYASISKDISGNYKDYGIVQFETVSDRDECIKIVKNFQLKGNILQVRPDVQEKRGTGDRSLRVKPSTTNKYERVPSKSNTNSNLENRETTLRTRKWKLADGYTLTDVVSLGFDVKTIVALLEKR